jgi:hypothetical protein
LESPRFERGKHLLKMFDLGIGHNALPSASPPCGFLPRVESRGWIGEL